MAKLFDTIRAAIAAERYVFSAHADSRLRERRIMMWQVVAGVEDAKLLVERGKEKPNPILELEQMLPDGMRIKAVWAYVAADETAKLVTVHFLER